MFHDYKLADSVMFPCPYKKIRKGYLCNVDTFLMVTLYFVHPNHI